MLAELGDRPLQVARELTKRHEQQVGPTVGAALEHFRQIAPIGECTVVLGGAAEALVNRPDDASLRRELDQRVASGLSSSDAARQLAVETGISRRELYALLHQPGPS